jgi:4-oxalocrotonate tautomerase
VPHITVKHWPRSFTDADRAYLVAALTEAATRVFACGADSVSLAVEAVEPERWTEEVYQPELVERAHLLWKQPNYDAPVPTGDQT